MARSKGLEVFKFGVYLVVPVCLYVGIAGDANVLNAIIKNRSYVVYPPEAPRPPTSEELAELIAKKQK